MRFFQCLSAKMQAYSSTRPMTCSRPSVFQEFRVLVGTLHPKYHTAPPGQIKTAPTLASGSSQSLYSSAPSVNKIQGIVWGFAVNFLGLPEVILYFKSFSAHNWRLNFQQNTHPTNIKQVYSSLIECYAVKPLCQKKGYDPKYKSTSQINNELTWLEV